MVAPSGPNLWTKGLKVARVCATVGTFTFLLLLGLRWFVLFVFGLALVAVFVDHSRRLAGGIAGLLQAVRAGHLSVVVAVGPGTLVVTAGWRQH